MDLTLLLRYLSGNSSRKEEKQLERWLMEDTDGSRAELYRDAHDIHDAMVLFPQSNSVARKASHWRNILIGTVGIAAAIVAAFLLLAAGRSAAFRKMEAMNESVKVPAGRTMELTMEDGTHVWLNSGTEITYPKIFSRKSRRLSLIKGQLLMDVNKDKRRPFIVETAAADVKVYGTRFDVSTDGSGNSFSAALFRGSIGVLPKNYDMGEILMENGETLTLGNDGRFRHGRLSPSDYSWDWTEGMVNMAGSDFLELMNRFEKAFGTTIVLRCKSVPVYNISRGRVRVIDGIDHALDVAQLASDFKYKHDYNTDTIIIY